MRLLVGGALFLCCANEVKFSAAYNCPGGTCSCTMALRQIKCVSEGSQGILYDHDEEVMNACRSVKSQCTDQTITCTEKSGGGVSYACREPDISSPSSRGSGGMAWWLVVLIIVGATTVMKCLWNWFCGDSEEKENQVELTTSAATSNVTMQAPIQIVNTLSNPIANSAPAQIPVPAAVPVASGGFCSNCGASKTAGQFCASCGNKY